MIYGSRSYGRTNSAQRLKYCKLQKAFESVWSPVQCFHVSYPLLLVPGGSQSVVPFVPPMEYLIDAAEGPVGPRVAIRNINVDTASDGPLKVVIIAGGKDQMALDSLYLVSNVLSAQYREDILPLCYEEYMTNRATYDEEVPLKQKNRTLFVLFEYPGYGFSRSGVDLTTENLQMALKSLIESVRRLYPSRYLSFSLVGYSMGCPILLKMAAPLLQDPSFDLTHLALVAPFDTFINAASSVFKRFVSRRMLKWVLPSSIQWNTSLELREFAAGWDASREAALRVMLLFGDMDIVCPGAMASTLCENLKRSNSPNVTADLILVEGANHNTICTRPLTTDTLLKLLDFGA